MNEKIKSENHQLKPLIEGKFIFKGIMEGDERKILFNPPLIIEYKILEKIDKESDKENFSEDWPLLASFFTISVCRELLLSMKKIICWLVVDMKD